MHRWIRRAVSFADDFFEPFDRPLLLRGGCVFCLLSTGVGALFSVPLEGFFFGIGLAVVLHMSVLEWNECAEIRRRKRRRSHTVFIDVNEVKLYSQQASSHQPPKGGLR